MELGFSLFHLLFKNLIMARLLRIQFPGALYHITSKGADRKKIFLNVCDREIFPKTLQLVSECFHWLCHSYQHQPGQQTF
jgi:hypothetical protein